MAEPAGVEPEDEEVEEPDAEAEAEAEAEEDVAILGQAVSRSAWVWRGSYSRRCSRGALDGMAVDFYLFTIKIHVWTCGCQSLHKTVHRPPPTHFPCCLTVAKLVMV
jgi:hypothetical protein